MVFMYTIDLAVFDMIEVTDSQSIKKLDTAKPTLFINLFRDILCLIGKAK